MFCDQQEKEERTGEGVSLEPNKSRLLSGVTSIRSCGMPAGKNESEEKRELIFKEDGQGIFCTASVAPGSCAIRQ